MSLTEFEIKDAFERAMRDAGIVPEFKSGQGIEFGQDTTGGKPRPWRFHIAGDAKGTRNGWYVLFPDGVPAGEFGSWKTGVTHSWCAKDGSTLTPEERAAIEARIAQARKEREEAQRVAEGEAAKRANLLWNEGVEVVGNDHPYLKRKAVRSHGLRAVAWPVRNTKGETFRHIDDTLVIPIYDHRGKIVSLQGVFPQVDEAFGRDKDFLVGGKKRGCFFMIGRPTAANVVAICEGYATGESIHQATGWCVVVAWDAYNVPHVAQAMREAMPQALFVFAADNDQWTKQPVDNPGVTYAKRAAAEVGGRVVWPVFAELAGEDDRPTDFNDLHMREGIDAVQSQVMGALPSPEPKDMPIVPAEDRPPGYYNPIDPTFIDVASPFPDFDGKGKPLPTPTNTAEMLRRIRAVVRYNVISKDVEILIPGLASTIDNQANASHAELLGWCARFRMSTANFDGNLIACADANLYNPVATWIDSKPWDGTPRIQQLLDTVVAKTDTTLSDGRSLKDTLMRKWLLSAVAAAFEPEGVVARGVLTFQSKQNLGKTLWVKRLAPRELGVIADGVILNPADKDSVKQAVSKWIVELGEVDATFRRADLAALKGFISKDRDELRRPYAKTESKFARRTVFFASVNPERFLQDETGNTRWWTINCERLDNAHTIDMQQVWAELYCLYREQGNGCWHLNAEEVEALNAHNSSNEALNPVHERVDKAFDWDIPRELWTRPMRATEIAEFVGIDRPTKKDVNECAAYVTQQYQVTRKLHGKARSTVWMMPPRTVNSSDPPL